MEGGNDTSNSAQFKGHNRDEFSFPQGPITRSKSKQIKSKLNLVVQDFITKKIRKEELKFQDNKFWSNDELEETNYVCRPKLSIYDDKPMWKMLTSLSISLQEPQLILQA